MHSSATLARQRQIRSFVMAWLGITLLMGALTFVGIYYATGLVNDDRAASGDSDVLAAPSAREDATAGALDSVSAESLPAAKQAPVQAGGAAAPAPDQPDGAPMAAFGGFGAGDALQSGATPIPTPTPVGGAAEQPPSAATTAPQAAISDEGFQLGVQVQANPDPEVYKIWMGEVRDKLKLNWIKQQVRWQDIEPEPGQYNWADLDVALPLAQEYGLKVMLSVVTAPDWAREPGNQRLDEVGPPADPQTYADFLQTLLYRFPRQVHAIEVWNEMNIDREWASIYGLSAPNYVNLLRTAYTAIKAVDPNIIVISGALSPTGWNDGVQAYDDFVYMDMLIRAGMLDTTDCVGAHHNGYNIGPNVPYNAVPNDPTARFRGPFDNPHHSWSFYSTLQGYAQRIEQAGYDTKLCITEFGWPTTEDLSGVPRGFEFAADNTLAEQAQFIGEAIDLMDDWGFVWLAFLWNLNYGPQAGWDPTNDNVPYSLLRPEWQQAPAYEVIASHDFRGS